MTFLTACIRGAAALTAISVLATAVPAQRGVVQLTSIAEVHQDAAISPDGQTVAFRGPSKLGIVTFAGLGENTLISTSSLGAFVWAPNSAGLYFLDGSDLKFVSRAGGTASLVQSITGQRVHLWAVDHSDTLLFGTRYDPATQKTSIFSLPTSGAMAAKDIVTSLDILDQVQVDPSDSRIVYRQYGSAPFSPVEVLSADLSGSNITSLTGSALVSNPEYPEWIDAGQSVAFTLQSSSSNRKHVGRIGPVGTQITQLTEGSYLRRLTAVSPDLSWVAMQAQLPVGFSPAVLPPDGGGLVLLGDPGRTYAFQGRPTMDLNGTRIAFAASLDGATSQVFGVTLYREVRVSPRAEVGNSFGVSLPVTATEVGAVLLGGGFGATPLTVPGFAGSFWLNPTVLLTVVSGSTPTGSLTSTIPVPNNPWLMGQELYLQGVRATGLGGDITRRVTVPIF